MEEIKCPHCGSTKLNRKGFNESGSQRYLCKDCGRKFTPGAKKIEPLNKICPHCQSKNIGRHGNTINGYKRYICKDCGKQFTDSTKVDDINEVLLDTCPHCKSKHIKKSGHLASGERRYYCYDCGKSFSKNTIIREKLNKTCPECGSDKIVRSGYNDNGTPRYTCTSCRKRFGDNEPRVYIQHKKTCPKCGYNIAIKSGKDHGRQLWICKSCNHKYSDEPKYTHISKEILDKIPILLEEGYFKKEISGMLGISIKTVQNYSKGLTTNQENRDKKICKGKATYSNKTSAETIEKIKQLVSEGMMKKDVAKQLNINTSTVSKYSKGLKSKVIIKKKQDTTVKRKKINVEQHKKDEILYNLELKRREEEKSKREIRDKNFVINNFIEEYKAKLKERVSNEFLDKFNSISSEYREDIITKMSFENKFNSLVSDELKRITESKEQENVSYDTEYYICKDVLDGLSEQKVAEKYLVSLDYVKKLMTNHYKLESINDEQKYLIYQYGVKMNVPIEYMAEYIHCSENMCRKMINKFKMIDKSKNKSLQK